MYHLLKRWQADDMMVEEQESVKPALTAAHLLVRVVSERKEETR